MAKKGCKITNSQKTKTVGVACENLKELIKKAREKLDFNSDQLTIALEDGTLVQDEEYFSTLPSQSVFVVYRSDEPILTGVDIILNALRSVNATYLHVSAEAGDVMAGKAQELSDLLKDINENQQPLGNTREADPQWFLGLETNAKTKEEFMYKKAQDRIRGYLYKFQDDAKKSEQYKNPVTRKVIMECLEIFKRRLITDGYYGCYFDRRCAVVDCVDTSVRTKKKIKLKIKETNELALKSSYCNANGLFTCEGLWKIYYCSYRPHHCINPYLNKESRVVFSTWNLDHKIEKSRTVLPALLSAAKSSAGASLNAQYFYDLLFTKINLKLVHIVCHDKGGHDINCDSSKFLLSS